MEKIMFVIGQLSNGGAERVVSVLANSFADKGFDVSVVTLIKDEVAYELDKKVNYINIHTAFQNKLLRIASRTSGLRKTIKNIAPDVIIAFTTEINLYAIVANKFSEIPLIISERNDPYRDPPQKIVRKLRDAMYRNADGFVFQTPDAKAYFSRILKDKGTVIPNPISGNLPERYEGERTKRIVTVSRLYPQKNLGLLIRAFANVHKDFSEYRLEIYGDGYLREELCELTRSMGIWEYVDFKGYQTDVYKKIYDTALFVLPSDYEGISNAMLEALGMGIPVVCTDCPIGGARMFISNYENGILVPVNDEAALTEAMRRILLDKELSDRISANATEICNILSPDKIADKWCGYIDSVVDKK